MESFTEYLQSLTITNILHMFQYRTLKSANYLRSAVNCVNSKIIFESGSLNELEKTLYAALVDKLRLYENQEKQNISTTNSFTTQADKMLNNSVEENGSFQGRSNLLDMNNFYIENFTLQSPCNNRVIEGEEEIDYENLVPSTSKQHNTLNLSNQERGGGSVNNIRRNSTMPLYLHNNSSSKGGTFVRAQSTTCLIKNKIFKICALYFLHCGIWFHKRMTGKRISLTLLKKSAPKRLKPQEVIEKATVPLPSTSSAVKSRALVSSPIPSYTPQDVITPDEWSDSSLGQSLIQLFDKVEKDEREKLE
ncbi:hypothetical protein TcasGA2_TC033887 [Tribolium castaneum]|uniref:Uncharacterized protein n=1 Tax=Tribolium castaneum TaxID=7070 RepID=A0A139WE44_TRICA|nr:hypothetical protein TcasGA2_TC033887 [Tribolium castaneum]